MGVDPSAKIDQPATQLDPKHPERTPRIADYLKIFSYAKKWDLCVYVIASVASIGAGVTLPLMNIVFGQLVSQFTDFTKASSSSQEFSSLLNQQALYITALFIVRWALSAINKFCFRTTGLRLSSAIRLHYIQSLLEQPVHAIDTMLAGAPATAITTTSNTLQLGISERLGTFLQALSTILAAIIVAFIYSWQLTLVTSTLIIYILVVMSIVLPVILQGQTAMSQANSEGTAIATEALEGIRLVMACGAHSRVINQYQRWVEEALKHGHKTAPAVGLQFGLIFFGMFGAFGLAFWYGTKCYVDGLIRNSGVIIIVLMSVMMMLTSLERLSTPLMAVSKAMVAACELFTVIDAPRPKRGSTRPKSVSGDIVFEDVTFEYPSRPGVTVLNGMNFRIAPGQTTAFVGPSGSGKSTIVGLLMRWYSLQYDEPETTNATRMQPGNIKVDDHDIRELDTTWWRRQIGLVQQEPFLFNGTIFSNVEKGLIGTEWEIESEERRRELVQEACQEAYADEFVKDLPDGYDTQVGDGGVKLSGGQKQRIAIARCIIKRPSIIILDEATSAIDTKSEKIVQAAIDRVTHARTTLLIAHRLSTVKQADQIIVLQNGRAVEHGTHQCLMNQANGVYSSLVKSQSLQLSETEASVPQTPAADAALLSEKLSKDQEQAFDPASIDKCETQLVEQPRNIMQCIGKLLYEQQAQWPCYMGIVLCSMAVAAGTPLQAWLFSKVLDVFLLDVESISGEATFWGLMWLALAAGVGLAYMILGWMGLHFQYFIGTVYKLEYFRAVIHQKLSFFDASDIGTITAQVAGDAQPVEELAGLNLAFFLSGMFQAIGCIIMVFVYTWQLGLIAMFVTMPVMLTSGYWRYRYEVQFDQMNSTVFTESSQFATEAIGAIRTVSALNMETTINNRYQKLLMDHVQAARRKAQWTSVIFGLSDGVSLGCQALVFWYGGKLLANGDLTMGAFFICFMALIQGIESASQALAVSPNASQATEAANRYFAARKSAYIEHTGSNSEKCIPGTAGGMQIDVKDIYFKYPTRDALVLENLSLSIEKGQYAAFVGPSGCGKSTILSLLERFYDLESGQGAILCDSVNINDVDAYAYRRNLAMVSQEPIMFRGTIRDNIVFGMDEPSAVSDESVHNVCRDAFIHDFIVSLPDGYDTKVGPKGVSLSGGQKQRIAIARALIRNPKLLLLDEATSALDSESEQAIQAALDKARAGRTMVSVAHRLSTVRDADVIFVFDGGRVVEQGSHIELLQRKGIYWEMCQSQALDS